MKNRSSAEVDPASRTMSPKPQTSARNLLMWAIVYLAVLVWSAVKPHDYFTWFLEVAPALAGGVVLAAIPLTRLAYVLILIHCIILMVGGHYTYAEVPLFNWLRDTFDMQRNNYDKIGHFAQGFVPAILAREIFIRKRVIAGRGWLNVLVVSICLAISAFYELIEWWVALLSRESVESFLGTQGYMWDTQSDMALALAGAMAALIVLGRMHDRQLQSFLAAKAGSYIL